MLVYPAGTTLETVLERTFYKNSKIQTNQFISLETSILKFLNMIPVLRLQVFLNLLFQNSFIPVIKLPDNKKYRN